MVNVAPPGGLGPIDTKQNFIAAERFQESGGNYQIVNPGSGALGAYQVMPSNLPGWLAQSGLPPMSAYQYLHNRQAQDQLAWVILGGYYDHYGAAGAAAMWYSGQPDPNKTYGDPPVYQYVLDVLALMGLPETGTVNTGTAPGGPAFNLPPPAEGDWSGLVLQAGKDAYSGAGTLGGYATAILRM